MSHWIVVPVALPVASALVSVFLGQHRLRAQRASAVASCSLLLAAGVLAMTRAAGGEIHVYRLGGWPPPFGIPLVVDRVSAVMLTLSALVSLVALLASFLGEAWDTRSRHFHAFFQLELAGLNGAFLTGDLFNLFVFFEVLLLASYCLLIHGRGAPRMRAGVHYVAVNLAASAFFLIGIGVVYGAVGTLNFADLALRIPLVGEADRALVRFAALLLLVVFGVKAAAVPLGFWLPGSYAAASPPVAALFAIMTKVGIYAILRVHGAVFGLDTSLEIVAPLLLGAALLSSLLGALAAATATSLAGMAGYLTIASVGTALSAASGFTHETYAAALFYAVHSTLGVGALFLLAGGLASASPGSDRLERRAIAGGTVASQIALLAIGMTVTGMPPSSGFVAKLMVLQAMGGRGTTPLVWTVLLASSFLVLAAFVRAGALLFWVGTRVHAPREGRAYLALAYGLVVATVALTIASGPAHRYLQRAAEQLVDVEAYAAAVLDDLEGSSVRSFFLERP